MARRRIVVSFVTDTDAGEWDGTAADEAEAAAGVATYMEATLTLAGISAENVVAWTSAVDFYEDVAEGRITDPVNP